MITKEMLQEHKAEIIETLKDESFRVDHHKVFMKFNDTYIYYVELIPPYPKEIFKQWAILWKQHELFIITGTVWDEKLNTSRKKTTDDVVEEFARFLEYGDYRPIVEKNLKRKREFLAEFENELKNIDSEDFDVEKPGYYLNGKYQGLLFPESLREKIISIDKGVVTDDDWDMFGLISEKDGVLSLFFWTVGR